MSDLVARSAEEVQAAESHAFALGALDAIAGVKTPEEAESLLARVKIAAEAARVMHLGKALSREWRGIEIKAERKWGELLGEADRRSNAASGRDGVSAANSKPSGADRVAQHAARKVAAVPEPVFEEYVETTDTPTKAGLLRAAAETTEEPVMPLADEAPDTNMNVRQRIVANATRDRADAALHRLDGMCAALAKTDASNATATATEEQIKEWLAMAARARTNLQRFAAQIQQASS